MIKFLQSLWRKLFGVKTGAYDSGVKIKNPVNHVRHILSLVPAYDPSQDENKKMNGEMESYFE